MLLKQKMIVKKQFLILFIKQENGLIGGLIQKITPQFNSLLAEIENAINTLPKVSGTSQKYISNDLNLALEEAEKQRKEKKLVDPLEFELSIGDDALIDYVPTFGWEREPATDKQRSYLENMQIEPDILVYNDPASVLRGEDKQLEAAVAEMLKEIDKK